MTDQEQYERDKAMHDAFIRGYKACMRDAEKAMNDLSTQYKPAFGGDVLNRLSSECSKREFMDAPNPPGYYRANND